jgi:hypothetical protein
MNDWFISGTRPDSKNVAQEPPFNKPDIKDIDRVQVSF